MLGLVRLRRSADAVHPEAYHPGRGWVRHPGATDVYRNGQDYDLLDEDEAQRLASDMEAGRA